LIHASITIQANINTRLVETYQQFLDLWCALYTSKYGNYEPWKFSSSELCH